MASSYQPLLPVKKPVPEDIEIAQSIEPVHISKIAEKLGLLPTEYDLYGIHKAKVMISWAGRGVGCSTAYPPTPRPACR